MDELSRLVTNAHRLVREGYYRVADRTDRAPSFLGVLQASDRPADVIAEIKFASPSRDRPRETPDFEDILARIVATRPLGLSILAEPRLFRGSSRPPHPPVRPQSSSSRRSFLAASSREHRRI